MALKRKLSFDEVDAPKNPKQLKLVPFPNYQSDDNDVAMSEAEPLYADNHHIRNDSNNSATSASSESSFGGSPVSAYPSFDIYPQPFFSQDGRVNPDSHNYAFYSAQASAVGLMQPSSGFLHHGSNCSQIPKLRVACASGMNERRTMYTLCEQCGAISMVDSD